MKQDNRKITAGNYFENITMSGNAKFVAGDDNSRAGLMADEVQNLFQNLYSQIDSARQLSEQTREDLKSEIEEIREQLQTHNKSVNEGFIMKRLRNIYRMSPDILEVTLQLLADPKAGFGLIAKKIVAKAREEIR